MVIDLVGGLGGDSEDKDAMATLIHYIADIT
jgi:hypothetical protein